MAQLTTEYLDKKLKEQTKELKSYTDEQTDALARIVNSAFEQQVKILGSLRSDIGKIDERLQIVETKLDKALYREFQRIDKLEIRMKVVEGKLGISQK